MYPYDLRIQSSSLYSVSVSSLHPFCHVHNDFDVVRRGHESVLRSKTQDLRVDLEGENCAIVIYTLISLLVLMFC